MTRYILAFLFIILNSTYAHALVFGPSNFSFGGYEEPSCYDPYVPYGGDSTSWELFKLDLETYTQCIKDYLEGAKNDRDRITEKMNEVIDDYNNFINSIR